MPLFRSITPDILPDNVFQMIGDDWCLVTAGTKEKCNTMTISWGGLGVLWNKNVCYVFIRPTRHTFPLMEKHEYFTLGFFEEEKKDILQFCGTNSGKDVNKIEKCELTLMETTNKAVYFQESRLVLECKKLYTQDIDPAKFLAADINVFYPQKDYHRLYIAEIVNVLEKTS